jgi:hypothetical protein
VGFLIERTRGRTFADRICGPDFEQLDTETRQLFSDWLYNYGFSAEELAMIQPGFFPQQNPPAGDGLSKAFAGLYQASLRRKSEYPKESLQIPDSGEEMNPIATTRAQGSEGPLVFSNLFDLLQSSGGTAKPIRIYLVSRQYGEPVFAVTFSDKD